MSGHNSSFGFPGTPYPIQVAFMSALYDGLTKGGVIVLESPTGTGKSLGLICGTLSWLMDNRGSMIASKLASDENSLDSGSDSETVPSWLRVQSEKRSLVRAQEFIELWNRQLIALRGKASKLGITSSNDTVSDPISVHKKRKRSKEVIETKIDFDEIKPLNQIPDDASTRDLRPRIFFCSRTHSQLSQIIREIQKTDFLNSLSMVTLSSRGQTCVNASAVSQKSSYQDSVDEECRKLVEKDNCSFFSSVDDLSVILSSTLKDIEDQCLEGLRLGACPYYAARYSARRADVVMVPYTSILSEEMRHSLDIDVQGNIVVIDEAHNLLDAAASSLTVRIDQRSLENILVSIADYTKSYSSVMAPRNLVSVQKFGFLVKRILKWTSSIEADSLFKVPAVIKSVELDSIDIGSVSLFLETTEFKRKIRGFMDNSKSGTSSGSVYAVHTFLKRIQHASEWDRVSVRVGATTKEVSYIAIDCESAIAQLVKKAKAVVLAGGTMKPIDEYRAIADSVGVPFSSFAASLRVEKERLCVGVVSKSLEGDELIYTNQHRSNEQNMKALRDIVLSVFAAEPRGGVIMFVSSYEYAKEVAIMISRYNVPHQFTVLCDSKGAKSIEILDLYRKHISEGSSILLISVVGGSLSEGIDFRDELCRCVMLVGLPYPHRTDPVLIERMKFYDMHHNLNPCCPDGNRYYHICCMRAVNQSLGRAIRHSRDWASLLLIDSRYNRPDIRDSLSDWIRDSLESQDIGSISSTLGKFFTTASRILK